MRFDWSTSVFSYRYEARKWREQYGWLCLQVVRIYSFMKEIKVYIRASYIVFLFVKTENNNFIKEIKHVLPQAAQAKISVYLQIQYLYGINIEVKLQSRFLIKLN